MPRLMNFFSILPKYDWSKSGFGTITNMRYDYESQ